jgi:hypothetical protein
MKRRNFIAGVGTLAAAPAISFAETQKKQDENRQYLEWIKYILPLGTNKGRVEKYYKDAAIPALNKIGIMNVGVFTVQHGLNEPTLFVLIPHDSLDSVMTYEGKLMKNDTYVKASADFHDTDISNPAYVRVEKGLMHAFKECPKVESSKAAMGADRIFELRIYESHTYKKGQKKISMFNEGGEIATFRETGLTPVFFGETLFGPMMPNLTYMVVFKNTDEQKKAWDKFRDHPDWIAIKDLEEYKDTVSNISDIILRPAGCSQL